MRIPSFMIAAGASGSGKTMLTCGMLQILKNRGYQVVSFKCGPDYIDPMFHSRVLGTKSRNLDSFLNSEETVKQLFLQNSEGYDVAVLEGVMGYYDGLAGISVNASAYDIARIVDTNTIFIANGKGSSVSVAAQIEGFCHFQKDSHIRGVILNRISPMIYPRMKQLIEERLQIPVYGYIPELKDVNWESRHLGLIMPSEIPELQMQLQQLAETLERSVEVDRLIANLQITKQAPASEKPRENAAKTEAVRIALAKDEAFCFFYEDNLELLRQMGAQLIPFSPIHDEALPEDVHGLLLYGGYPELFAKELSENHAMLEAIRQAAADHLPCMAECGGFMYLHDSMEDAGGCPYEMAGVIPGKVYKTNRLNRFGYMTMAQGTAFGTAVGKIPAHEFHYFDSDNCGEAFLATKPLSEKMWRCMHSTDTMLAGFPHLHYWGNPEIAELFMKQVRKHEGAKGNDITRGMRTD